MKYKPIPKRFFKEPRIQIVKILVEELQGWKSTTAISTEEFLRLTDRLVKLK